MKIIGNSINQHISRRQTLSASVLFKMSEWEDIAPWPLNFLRHSFDSSTWTSAAIMGRVKRSKTAKRQNAERARECLKEKQGGETSKEGRVTPAATSHASTSHTHPPPPQHSLSPHTTHVLLSPQTSSAKKRKLEVYQTSQPSIKTTVDDENLILKKSYLEELFTHVTCSHCFGKLNVSFVNIYTQESGVIAQNIRMPTRRFLSSVLPKPS